MLKINNGKRLRFKVATVIVCLALIVIVGIPGHASDSFKLSVADKQGIVGEQIYVTIKAHNAYNLEGGEFILHYDARLIKPVAYSSGKFLSEGSNSMHMANLDYKPGQAKFMWITAHADSPAEGDLFTMKILLLKEGDVRLSFSEILISPDEVKIGAIEESSIKVVESGEGSGSGTSPAGDSNNGGDTSNPKAVDSQTTSTNNYSFTESSNEHVSSDIEYAASIIQGDHFFVIALNVVLVTVIAAVLIIKRKNNLINRQNSNEAKSS